MMAKLANDRRALVMDKSKDLAPFFRVQVSNNLEKASSVAIETVMYTYALHQIVTELPKMVNKTVQGDAADALILKASSKGAKFTNQIYDRLEAILERPLRLPPKLAQARAQGEAKP